MGPSDSNSPKSQTNPLSFHWICPDPALHCTMPAPNPIRTIGTILAPASPRTYRTALPNGKEILAHLSHRRAAALGPLEPQTRVTLEMTSYDFSIGRIAGIVPTAAPPP